MLACGHEPSPHGEHTTGTARAADGREICWECADREQREEMRNARDFVGYLASDGSAITTWSGGHLARVTRKVSRKVGFHGSTRVYFDAIDDSGKAWYGNSPGPGMYAKLHARKV